MNLTTIIRHRDGQHAAPSARLVAANRALTAENGALRTQLADANTQRQTEVAQIADVLAQHVRDLHDEREAHARDLHDEREAHARTKQALQVAIRANEANASATTCETDVTALRAATADQYIESPKPKPAYRPHPRPAIRVMPLHQAPFATVSPVWTPAVAA